MLEGLAEDEPTAEEALKTYAEICSTYHFCDGCPIGDGDVKDHKEYGYDGDGVVNPAVITVG